MRVSYAQHADVLYIVFRDAVTPCVYVELESGVICRIEESTDQIVGITIPYFQRRTANKEAVLIPELDAGLSADKLLLESED